MFIAVVGHSEDLDAGAAAEEILAQCRAGLKGTAPAGGLLFAAIDFDHQVLLAEINRQLPGIALIGCSTDGEISSHMGFREDSVTLILFASDTVEITAGVGRGLSSDVVGACRSAVNAAKLGTTKPASLCLAMPEGLTAEGHSVPGEARLRGCPAAPGDRHRAWRVPPRAPGPRAREGVAYPAGGRRHWRP